MKVILIRHGEAERETPIDSQRQLTEFGKKQAAETAEYILNKYKPDQFIVSPYVRAKQTLAEFTSIHPEVPVSINSLITPEDDATKGLHSLIDIKEDCVVIICHMPIVAKMAGLLTASDPESYQLAEARVFEADFIAPDMGEEIERFVPNQ